MLVIVDIEWVMDEQGRGYPTQLAAVRTDSEPDEEPERFCAFIAPKKGGFLSRAGAAEEEIMYAKSAYSTFSEFLGWLSDEDVLLFRHEEVAEVYRELIFSLFGRRSRHRIICADELIRGCVEEFPSGGGISMRISPQHCHNSTVAV